MNLVRNIYNYLILGMAMAIPFLVFSVFENGYEFPKILIFKVSVCFLFGLKLLELKSWRNLGLWLNNLFSKKRKATLILLLLFIIAQISSIIFSIDKARSFWGSPERWWGLTTQIPFVIFLFLLFDFFSQAKNSKNFFLVISFSAVVMSIFAIVQRLGYVGDNFVYTRGFALPRPDGTLGHPNYLGTYLAMVLSVLYYFLFFIKRKIGKVFCFLGVFLILIALHNTINRGGYLAAYFSAVLFFIYYFCRISGSKDRFQKALLSFLFATLIFISFWTGLFLPKGQAPSEQNFGEGSMLIRFLDMGAASDFFYQRPFFGYGAENYLLLYEKRDKWSIEQKIDNHPSDRVHNWFFDNLINFGLFGVIAISFFWLSILQNVFLKLKSKTEKLKGLLCLSVFTAYLTALQFHFDTLVSTFLLYSFFAYCLSDEESFVFQEDKQRLSILILSLAGIFFGIFLLVICLM